MFLVVIFFKNSSQTNLTCLIHLEKLICSLNEFILSGSFFVPIFFW